MKDKTPIFQSLLTKRNIFIGLGIFVFSLVFFGSNIFQPKIVEKKPVDIETEDPTTLVKAAHSAVSVKKEKYLVSSSTPQFVVFSFDGSKSVDMLNETLDFEKKLAGEGKPLHFTYFVNAAYFLSQSTANLYQAPGQPVGKSMIGFSDYKKDIPLRVA
ncbi:MAG: hypothetical protein PHV42_01670, partial [Candidatus Pacebacteria bacterium]|nr:hypothetical protein [Candidatus Paceibacterota bacterium]